ncbi:MAG: malate dehydrogenase (oxaloacetate-decarboxylating)(NADP+), partial [Sphingobacteriales bacterium]
LLKEIFPFSELNNKRTNVLIFPNLSAGNIAYKLMDEMTDAEVIGPIVLGLNKPFHVLTMGCSVREIVAMTTLATIDAQRRRG